MTSTPHTPYQTLKELAVGKFTILCKVTPVGTLQARRQANNAIMFFWRYSIGNISERVPIGQYDAKAPPKSLKPTACGYSYVSAIRAAEAMAEQHYQNKNVGGRPAILALGKQSQRLAEQKRFEAEEVQKAAAVVRQEAEKHTLKKLLEDYCNHLEKQNRRSHSDARSIFKLHVYDAWPLLALKPANTIEAEQIVDMMRSLASNGKGRTANKLRSYVRAAYQVAIKSRLGASVSADFKNYQVRHNPASETIPDGNQNRADKNPLKTAQIRLYWQTIKKLSGFKGAALRLHLLTGGQRLEQLVRLLTDHVEPELIVVYDGKGRPGKSPRKHGIPLIKLAQIALIECKPMGKFALTTDGGKTHLSASTLSGWAMEAVEGIEELQGFQAKRIRSGVETLLAAAGVPEEVRGRLQSHGISGIQSTHYNGHGYYDEKHEALETLLYELEQPIDKPVKRK
jgi:hypothetical protein